MRFVVLCVSALLCVSAVAKVGAKPFSAPLPRPIPEPRDQLFVGTIQLHVDATDTIHSLFRVSKTIPVQTRGEMVLLYPEWETTSHGPTASAIELAGLRMHVDGKDIEWRRDTIDVHAFHLTTPAGAHSLTLDFEYLSPRSSAKLRREMIDVEWQHLLLYPAGWFARDIPVDAQLELPKGLRAFTALTPLHTPDSLANLLAFAPETLDRLVDAPVYAARYTRELDLSSSSRVPVHLDLLADEPADLEVSPTYLAELQALVVQASEAFDPAPFRHYDALVSLSDQLSPGGGLEHLDEGENNLPANYFTASGRQLNNRDLIAHEYVHTWNGRFFSVVICNRLRKTSTSSLTLNVRVRRSHQLLRVADREAPPRRSQCAAKLRKVPHLVTRFALSNSAFERHCPDRQPRYQFYPSQSSFDTAVPFLESGHHPA
jgi:hypothetical protein